MATQDDRDRFFTGQVDASSPKHLLGEGTISRLLNGRFIEGAITNAIGFDEFFPSYGGGEKARLFAKPTTYQQLIDRGDIQLVAPMQNTVGKFLVVVSSGVLFRIDLETCEAVDITPRDACLPINSCIYPLSYLDNDGGTLGVGAYLVIFNYPNKTIFVEAIDARTAKESNYETPPSRMGATAGSRAFVISGDNLMWASDPLGGGSSLAPLTFQETYPGGTFAGQIFTIGSALDIEYVTAICRLPRFLAASQDFTAQQLLVSTTRRKFIIAASAPRASWESIQFITYAGSADGIAGPLACTNIGDVLIYISTTGRIKTIGQDQDRETGLAEVFLDDPLGQYLCPCEASYYYRDWYQDLDHSRGVLKFVKDRLYATVYPISVPAIGQFGEDLSSPSHRALAVGSLDSTTQLGPKATIAWEGFYDWIQPIGVVTLENDLYVVSKDYYGKVHYLKQNLAKVDDHNTTIYSRGYFAQYEGKSRSMMKGSLYFRRLSGPIRVKISYLINENWICGSDCVVTEKLHRFVVSRESKCKTASWSIPIKVDIEHKGCRFELESIRVEGEIHREDK